MGKYWFLYFIQLQGILLHFLLFVEKYLNIKFNELKNDFQEWMEIKKGLNLLSLKSVETICDFTDYEESFNMSFKKLSFWLKRAVKTTQPKVSCNISFISYLFYGRCFKEHQFMDAKIGKTLDLNILYNS